jgi:predicted glycoside hydrolase/deacetylase ChbG (UPF0249 family)
MTCSASALIVVADDFGASPGANAGIVTAHGQGIVTAAALMVGLPDTEEAASLARDTGLAVGLHLRLTAGPALTEDIRRVGLATEDAFRSLPAVLGRLFRVRRPVRDAIRAEIGAQMEALLVLGLPSGPDHVNTHHHLHLHPALLDIVLEAAARYGFPAVRWPVEPWWGPGSVARASEVWALRLLAAWGRDRLARSDLRTSDHFRGLRLMGRHLTPEALIATLRSLPPGTTELMCHPGQPDEGLARFTSYTQDRAVELATLTDSRVRRVVEEEGIVLTTYSELTNRRMEE